MTDEKQNVERGDLARAKFNKWAKEKVRWTLRASPIILVIILGLHKLDPDSIEDIARIIGINVDHLLVLIVLGITATTLEGFYSLEDKIANPPITVHLSESLAYEHLCSIIKERHVQRVDLIQVSGQTAMSLLTQLSQRHKDCQVRLLLLHSDVAKRFDDDNDDDEGFDHVQRAYGTKSNIQILKTKGSRFDVKIKYYRSYPGVCAVIVDEAAVCVGWYRTFFDGAKVIRVRSHNVPAVVADDTDAEPLLTFARGHFDKLWEFGELSASSTELTQRAV